MAAIHTVELHYEATAAAAGALVVVFIADLDPPTGIDGFIDICGPDMITIGHTRIEIQCKRSRSCCCMMLEPQRALCGAKILIWKINCEIMHLRSFVSLHLIPKNLHEPNPKDTKKLFSHKEFTIQFHF